MGTLEQVMNEVANAFQPLVTQIEDKEVTLVLAELGLQLPLTAEDNEALGNALSQVSDEVKETLSKIQDIKKAVEDDDLAAAIAAAIEAITHLRAVYNGLAGIGNSIKNDIGAAAIGITQAELEDFVTHLPVRLAEYLLITSLETHVEPLVRVLEMLQVVERTEVTNTTNPSLPAYTKKELHPGALFDFISSPGKQLETLYDWGKSSFDGSKLFKVLAKVLLRAGVPIIYDEVNAPGVINAFFAKISIDNSGSLPGLLIEPAIDLRVSPAFHTAGDGWSFDAAANLSLSNNAQLILFPDGKVKLTMPGFGGAQLTADLKTGYTDKRLDILTIAGGSGVTAESFTVHLENNIDSNGDGSIAFSAALNKVQVKMDMSGGDGFTKKVAGSGFETEIDLKFGYSSTGGFFIEGSGSFQIKIPTHITLGPIEINALTLALGKAQGKLPLTIGGDIRTTLGPLQIVVQDIGCSFELSSRDDNSGNLGRFQLTPSFKAPSGIGITVDAGGIKGGGILAFFPDQGEYYGGLELEFKDLFSLKAFGIINTRMPDGSEGFSMLIIITAEFTPIQLGFGFTLNGVGGLLGVNRTVKIDVLKEGLKTNTLKSILFPENIVANISQIVSDIKQVFPPQNGHFLICPMGKIGWGTPTLITLELGLLIEIPATRLVILGVLKALLPEESAPVLKMQVNFLGVIDFENKTISFDAILFDSRLLAFTLTGQMALRIGWGAKKIFLLSVGGFHPAFKEIPADLQNMQRVTISLLSGDNPRITIQTYFAITSNTAQFGARAELYAEGGGFNIYGFIGYDVLFQFVPFHFIAEFAAGIALRRHTSVIMSINVSGELSGPSPWDVRGKASISFFFFSVSVSFHETWGDPALDSGKTLADLLDLLTKEINDNRNWKADIPSNNKLHVSIKQIDTADGSIVVHPFGVLTFSERLVPLELDINKFGNQLPKDVKKFEIKPADGNIPIQIVKEEFAPANFFNMKDEEKLSAASFEEMKSGFSLTGSGALQVPPQNIIKHVDYEFSYLREKKIKRDNIGPYKFPVGVFKAGTKAAPASKSTVSYGSNRVSVNAPEAVQVAGEQFVIANTSDMKLYSNELVADTYTEAMLFYNSLVQQKPELKNRVQILSQHELNVN